MKIQNRLTIYFAALVVILFTGRSAVNYTSVRNYTEKRFYERLQERAMTTADRLLKVNRIDSSLLKEIDLSQYDALAGENISIYDSTFKEIYSSNDTIFFATSPGLFQSIRDNKYLRYSEGPYKVLGIYYTGFPHGIYITAGAIDDDGTALLEHYRTTLLLTFLGSILVSIIMGWFFVGRVLKPIAAIVQSVATLSPVEHSERLPGLTEKDEIAKLVETFNRLFDKLEDSFKLQKGFVSNASHELFNPLTKIKTQLEVSLMQDRDGETYRQTMRSVLEDLNDLIIMVQDLLDFSKMQADYQVTHQPLRIDELLFDVRDHLLGQHPHYRIHIDFINPPQSEEWFIINANRQLLFTAIKNIVENACKFSPDNSASLNLVFNDAITSLTISDKGLGIPEKEIARIFEPFYRSSNSESVKGFGIGLALTHRILVAHNFAVKVQSVVGAGTTFTIQFSN